MNATEESTKCPGCSQACPAGHCDGHPPACTCHLDRTNPTPTSDDNCKKCDIAKTLALENSKTKCKLEHLRLVMQQKKERREARKLKTMPYASAPPKTIAAPDQQPPLQEEIETVA